MTALRRHLRAWTTAWLLCQATALAAFAPQSCCLAHQTEHTTHGTHQVDAGHPEHCADPAIPADRCPMRGVTGEACPMHSQPSHPAHAELADPFHSGDSLATLPPAAPAHEDCAIRGVCNGPGVAVASLFPMPAVLADEAGAGVDAGVSPVLSAALDLPKLPVSPDTPPPRG